MPKAKLTTQPKTDAKSLPEVLELHNLTDREDVAVMLDQLFTLQAQLGRKPDNKKGRDGAGLLGQIDSIKQQLSSIIAVEGLDGLRHNNIAFTDCWVDGRVTVDVAELKTQLALEGVDLGLLNRSIEACTKRGDGYARRMLVDLSKPRESWGEE